MSKQITHILFDLGRVLINLDGPPPLRDQWLPQPLSDEEKWLRWGACQVVVDYESGKISAAEFVRGVIRHFNLSIDEQSFRQAFVRWPKGFLTGAEELLKQLKPRFKLAFYSNTSDLHLPQFMERIGLEQYFDYAFASYQIGYFKPDIKGFRHVQQSMAVDCQQILFVDDLLPNVEAARSIGMSAEQVLGVAEVKDVLRRYACIT